MRERESEIDRQREKGRDREKEIKKPREWTLHAISLLLLFYLTIIVYLDIDENIIEHPFVSHTQRSSLSVRMRYFYLEVSAYGGNKLSQPLLARI